MDYLQSLNYVDAERIGALGICAGGGYSVNAAMTDHRIKAVATVSAFNMGTGFRRDWDGLNRDSAATAVLDQAAKQRTAEAQGAELAMGPYVPAEIDENTNRDMREAHDHYLTPRAQHPNTQPPLTSRPARHLSRTGAPRGGGQARLRRKQAPDDEGTLRRYRPGWEILEAPVQNPSQAAQVDPSPALCLTLSMQPVPAPR